ncbi:MAG: response regulator transcription factor [Prevotella sp.]|nr:response regulator transcription factor [Prevotella sp.]MBQ4414278.1 response regulator transcription factor [Prevotella sp.]MBQ6055947.1 response regulator transcription factor [Prevotella sp.]MBR0187131.1 response regulator transcription factor [Prevotella sp.]MBR0390521.1 response regulator transcription factor [Prevotella sp.]
MRILIIEDEQSNADRLKRMLEGEHEMAGVCASNAEVRAFFADEAHADIDLILSDIQLGDGLSFESLKTVPTAIPVIFTTAYDQYAVQAFQFNSIDYLLKPIDSEELHAALEKVQSSLQAKRASSSAMVNGTSTTDAIAQILASMNSGTIRYRERFLIPHKADEFLIVPVSEVSHITIRDGVVRLCTLNGKTHTLNMTLEEAESQLDPQRFMRVNRQFIVNAAAVSKLSTYFLGKMRIHVAAFQDTEIIVSKDKVASVKRWLDS